MTGWYAPNQQAVGVDPAAAEFARPAAAAPATKATAPVETFDPADYTVAEVVAYLDANPDQRDAVVKAERAGKNRTGITGG